jgi:hypothetical protein
MNKKKSKKINKIVGRFLGSIFAFLFLIVILSLCFDIGIGVYTICWGYIPELDLLEIFRFTGVGFLIMLVGSFILYLLSEWVVWVIKGGKNE